MKYNKMLMSELGNEYGVFSVKFFKLFCIFGIFHDKMAGVGVVNHFFYNDLEKANQLRRK